jgi:hypothetical protein
VKLKLPNVGSILYILCNLHACRELYI